LSPVHCGRLVENLLHSDVLPSHLTQDVLDIAEGSPLFVEEILRALIDQSVIVTDGAIGSWRVRDETATVELPKTLRGVLAARIDRLPYEIKRVLEMASVAGRVFRHQLLESVSSSGADGTAIQGTLLRQHLIALQREEMIRERARIPEPEYAFKHELTREAAYDGILKQRRSELHRRVAEALERSSAGREVEQVGLLAYHWEQAGDSERAVHYLHIAGDQARLAYANLEALDMYRRALALLVSYSEQPTPSDKGGSKTAQIEESLADVLELRASYDESREAYESALSKVGEGGRLWRARLRHKIGNTWRQQREYVAALDSYDGAESELGSEPTHPDPSWRREWVQIQLERMQAYYWMGDWRRIAALVEKTRAAVQEHGSAEQKVSYFQNLFQMGLRRDRYVVSEDTLALARATREAARETGSTAHECHSTFAVGFAQLWHGDVNDAEATLQNALRLCDQTGDAWIRVLALTYLTTLWRMLGHVEHTCHYVSLALAGADAAKMQDYVAMAKANQAWLAWRAGSREEAKVGAKAALELWEQSALIYPFQWAAVWLLVAVALEERALSEAIDLSERLLDPTQQRLPEDLSLSIERAGHAWTSSNPERAQQELSAAIESASRLGFL
jgi:tetratricopeptide (TPR) repeat protein